MTFDERIDRLTERHEALTQSLELFARELEHMREDQRKLQSFVMDIAEGTARLLTVAENHERRLSRLEGTD